MPKTPKTTNTMAAVAAHRHARRELASAMIQIGRATDPMATFKKQEPNIRSAMRALGRDYSANRFLESCGVALPDSKTAAETTSMPISAQQALHRVLREAGAQKLAIQSIAGGEIEGFDVRVSVDDESHDVFVLKHEGRWVVAAGPIGREDIAAAISAFREHFDFFVAMLMHQRGDDDEQILDAREAIAVERTLLAGERDPHGRVDEFPLVFVMANASNLDRSFYCAYDPVSGRAEPYDYA